MAFIAINSYQHKFGNTSFTLQSSFKKSMSVRKILVMTCFIWLIRGNMEGTFWGKILKAPKYMSVLK